MATPNNTPKTILNEYEVARIAAMSVASIRRFRLLRQGPAFKNINSAVRYRREDLEASIKPRPTGSERAGVSNA